MSAHHSSALVKQTISVSSWFQILKDDIIFKKKAWLVTEQWDHLISSCVLACPWTPTLKPGLPAIYLVVIQSILNTEWPFYYTLDYVAALLTVYNFETPEFCLAPAQFFNLICYSFPLQNLSCHFEIAPHLWMHHSTHHKHTSAPLPLAPTSLSVTFQPLPVSWPNTQQCFHCVPQLLHLLFLWW